jgi:predicted ATP-dependent Lon-type protease
LLQLVAVKVLVSPQVLTDSLRSRVVAVAVDTVLETQTFHRAHLHCKETLVVRLFKLTDLAAAVAVVAVPLVQRVQAQQAAMVAQVMTHLLGVVNRLQQPVMQVVAVAHQAAQVVSAAAQTVVRITEQQTRAAAVVAATKTMAVTAAQESC